ncbi:hypothetical protein Gpo141_00010810 [Globisporangium polare]
MANLRLRPTALEAEHGAAMEANNGPPPGTSNRWSHPRHGAINIFEAKTAAMAEPRANMEARAVDHHHRDRNSATAASPLEGALPNSRCECDELWEQQKSGPSGVNGSKEIDSLRPVSIQNLEAQIRDTLGSRARS